MAKSSVAVASMPNASPRAPVLAIGFGRGFGGKSTLLTEVAYRARNQGRDVIVADFDARSKTLADLFPGAVVPQTEELPDLKTEFSKLLNRMAKDKASAVVDFGGGDRFMLEYGRDLRLVEFCERRGIEPVAIYVLGPEVEDLRHCLSIYEAGYFRPKRTILMLNEGVIREGRTVVGAFEQTMADPGFQRMVSGGAVPMLMTRLPCMDAIKERRLNLYEAATNGQLDPVEEFMLDDWLADLETKRQKFNVGDWLP
ncbi:hypothetical protein SAE02_71790 [Skermanella aerolata]|uniref:CobQ/CobB/MinD/ParA nucleotide binding domain-containing protein n=1 Tax=Skermanella aerolata TaxID=393310 RepID=A0A512E2S8_9PROT|nr:hypothetical protein [Skermanella aerolata]GEO43031.1 hypothetical protein SAE02_71790 [Skermanella aerolata]